MDYKNKYEQSLERARIAYKDEDKHLKATLKRIFPELKEESEEEKTKKEIINYLKCQSRDEPTRKDTHNKWINYIERHALSKDDYDFLRNCARVLKIFGYQSYADRLTGLCPALGEEAKAMMATPIIFDESKDDRIRKEIINYFEHHPNIIVKREKKSDYIAWLERVGEQKSAETLKWSPQEESCICQLELLVKEQWRQAEIVHNSENIKNMSELMFFLKTLNPNKKPQRIISAEAKEAMYDKAAWTKEDMKMIEILIGIFEVNYPNSLYKVNPAGTPTMQGIYSSEIIKWLKSLKDKVLPQSQKEWSEKDERLREYCINAINGIPYYSPENKQELVGWLKSLRPQNWTKEDKERYISCLQRLGTGNPEQPETINSKWFKEHVYPQSTWKPSDEQMNLLKELVEDNNQRHFYTILRSLYEQLKKLIE